MKNLKKIEFSKKNFSISLRFFIRNANFSKIFINNPQNLYYPLVLNTQNENYMKVWYPQLRRRQHGKPSKSPWAGSAPPLALLEDFAFHLHLFIEILNVLAYSGIFWKIFEYFEIFWNILEHLWNVLGHFEKFWNS